jgi:hypothetical protein
MDLEVRQLRELVLNSSRAITSSAQVPTSHESEFNSDWQPQHASGADGSSSLPHSASSSLPEVSSVASSGIPQHEQVMLDPSQSCSPSSQIHNNEQSSFLGTWQPQLYSSCDVILNPLTQTTSQPSHADTRLASSTPYRILGDVSLTIGQVTEHFRTYFARCHPYLPFKMKTHSTDEIYSKCPLLFWVICAVTSTWQARKRFAPLIKAMVANILHSPSRSVEIVQALLILCVWPFSVSTLNEDPSHFYSSLAAQMGLQLGLHCPAQAHSHKSEPNDQATAADNVVKTTIWLACFVVEQMQSSWLGVPPSMMVDNHLIRDFDHPAVDRNLSQMCRIYRLLVQSTLALSSYGPTSSVPLEAHDRLATIKTCGEQFSTLLTQHLGNMTNAGRIVFLSSKMQLWSFALFDDVPKSTEQAEIVKQAETDACSLIDLCYGLNISITPYYVRRAMCYCAFVLVKILRSGQATHREVLNDNIGKVREALIATVDSEDDIIHKACQYLQDLPYLEDKRLSPPIVSRMGVSILYDLLRIYVEHHHHSSQSNEEAQTLDLDGFDWNTLGL